MTIYLRRSSTVVSAYVAFSVSEIVVLYDTWIASLMNGSTSSFVNNSLYDCNLSISNPVSSVGSILWQVSVTTGTYKSSVKFKWEDGIVDKLLPLEVISLISMT